MGLFNTVLGGRTWPHYTFSQSRVLLITCCIRVVKSETSHEQPMVKNLQLLSSFLVAKFDPQLFLLQHQKQYTGQDFYCIRERPPVGGGVFLPRHVSVISSFSPNLCLLLLCNRRLFLTGPLEVEEWMFERDIRLIRTLLSVIQAFYAQRTTVQEKLYHVILLTL